MTSDREELRQLKALLAHVPGYIVLCDLEARILYLNRTAYGFSMDQVIGRSYDDFLGPDQAAQLRTAHAALRETGEEQVVEYQLETPESGRRHLLTRVAGYWPDDAGKLRGFIHVVTDVTDRRVAEQRVAELEAIAARRELAQQISRTEKILATMQEGYILVDGHGIVTDANQAIEEMLGLTGEQMLGKPLGTGLRLLEPSFEEVGHRLLAGELTNFSGRAIRPDGREILMEVSVTPFEHEGHRYLIGIERDVTEERKAERDRAELSAQMQKQHRLQSLGTLAGGAAHEINNPVQSIIAFAELVRRGGGAAADYASEILEAASRISDVIKSLATFARAEREKMSPAKLHEIVEATVRLLRRPFANDGIELIIDVADDLPAVRCRRQQICEVLLNLLTNARDALVDGGGDGHRIRVTGTVDDGDTLRLTVEDNGPGIAEDHLPFIFDPFFTTRESLRHSGLGLAVSHGIAVEHHGRLRADVAPGRPTRMHLELPL